MAFLKLRDQVGEGLRGRIAPTGVEGRGGQASGPAVGAIWAPSWRAGCEGGWGVAPASGVGLTARGQRATRLSAKPGPCEPHVPLGGSPPPSAAAARGAGPALAAWASASGALPGLRLLSPAR